MVNYFTTSVSLFTSRRQVQIQLSSEIMTNVVSGLFYT